MKKAHGSHVNSPCWHTRMVLIGQHQGLYAEWTTQILRKDKRRKKNKLTQRPHSLLSFIPNHFCLTLLHVYVCDILVCVCVFTNVRTYVWTCMWKPEADVRCLPPSCSIFCYVLCLLLDLDLINLASLANQIFLVYAVIGDLPHPPSFCRAMEVINSTPSVCIASTSSTETCPPPHHRHFCVSNIINNR